MAHEVENRFTGRDAENDKSLAQLDFRYYNKNAKTKSEWGEREKKEKLFGV